MYLIFIVGLIWILNVDILNVLFDLLIKTKCVCGFHFFEFEKKQKYYDHCYVF